MTADRWLGCKRACMGLGLSLLAACVNIDALRDRSCGPRCDDDDDGGGVSDAGTDAALRDASSDAAAPGDAGDEAGADAAPMIVPPELPECADHWVDELGTHGANTDSAGNDFNPSCASGKANDSSFYFVVPETGYYEISTTGSSFDNSLALVSASCNGKEIACSKANDTNEALILRKLEADDDYVIVVDGNSGSHGAVELSVNRISCPNIDLGEQTLPLTGTTSDGSNEHDGSCGGEGQREKAFLWTAAADGLYAFKLTSTKLEPVLYVEQGLRCGGELLGCNRGAKGLARAQVTRRVAAGESVTLIVDSAGGAGTFTLDVETLTSSACPGTTQLMSDPPVMRTLASVDPSTMTGSCVPTETTFLPGGTYPLPDHSYSVLVPAGYGCIVSVEASAEVALYVLEGEQCAGPEHSCKIAEGTTAPYYVSANFGDFTSDTPSSWVVVVESASPRSGDMQYTLSVGYIIP